MVGAGNAVHYRQNGSGRGYAQATRALLAISGSLLFLAGAVIAIGGYLSPMQGSAFHMLVGLGLIVSGALIAKRHRAGACTYILVFAGTLVWSLHDLDEPFGVRLAGPIALLIVLALLMPPLFRWQPQKAARAFTVLTLGTVAIGLLSTDRTVDRSVSAVVEFLRIQPEEMQP